MKTYEERHAFVAKFNIIDDEFFYKMAQDPEVCEEMLHIFLSKPDISVIKAETQKFIRNIGNRSVQVDLLCEDSTGRHFQVEMQKADDNDHIKRVRYNASNVDTTIAEKGIDFADLPDLYMIYVTKNDFLNGNKTIYHVERKLAETGELVYNGINEIYINAKVDDGTLLADFMKLIKQSNHYNDKRFPKTSKRLEFLKETQEGVNSVCDLVENYAQKREREYAVKQIESRNISLAKEMLTDNMPLNEILKYSKLTLEKIQELAKEMGKTIVA